MIEQNEVYLHTWKYIYIGALCKRKIQISSARELSTAEIYTCDENFYENEEPRYTDKRLR